ncbi:MAG TPA: hypothetical protein PLB91_01130 [Spirochaetales bacterium]|nr:hypothetical protein [Spirochaetales bacterium]
MEIFLEKLSSYGSAPFLLVVAFLLGWVIRKLEENGKKDEARAEALKAAMAAQMNEMEERFEKRFAAGDKRIDELSTRMACVERDYLPREEHYKEFSGWRAEINNLTNIIINLFKEKSS